MGIAGAAGAGLSVLQGTLGGILQQRSLKAESKALREAAATAEEQAELARDLERRRGRELEGQQVAAFAAGGVRVDTGTPLDILAENLFNTEVNAARAAFGFEQQAESFAERAADAKHAAKTAVLMGILGGASSALGGVSGIGGGGGGGGFSFPSGTTGGFDSSFPTSGIA